MLAGQGNVFNALNDADAVAGRVGVLLVCLEFRADHLFALGGDTGVGNGFDRAFTCALRCRHGHLPHGVSTNVGAIFRSAAALGIGAVVLSPRCADPLYRRSVKVSMGAVFAIPYARLTDWYGGLAAVRAAGFRLLALTPDPSAVPIGALRPGMRAALMLGAEGDGLSSRWVHEADEAVCIPMDPAARSAGVDSLNVVAAAAIACYCLAVRPAA